MTLIKETEVPPDLPMREASALNNVWPMFEHPTSDIVLKHRLESDPHVAWPRPQLREYYDS